MKSNQHIHYRDNVTRYFFDTEFMEDGKTVELLSIGIVSDDGREYYAANREADQSKANDWVKQNVLPHLPADGSAWWKTREEIRDEIVKFVRAGVKQPEFWAYYCVAPETRVLTADLRWVPIGSLHVGAALMGFDEHAPPGKGRSSRPRQWRRTSVETFEVIQSPCYDLTFDDGTKVRCSADHRWLVSDGTSGSRWQPTVKLRSGTTHVVKPLDVWSPDDSRGGGYLAAAFDGEGHITQTSLADKPRGVYRFRLGFAQMNNAMLAEVQRVLHERGYTTSVSGNKKTGVRHVTIGNRHDVFRFLGSVRPLRLLSKFNPDCVGALTLRTVRLVEKVDAGVRDVVSIKTDAGTYIAEGLASHNCSYDWLVFCQLFGCMSNLPDDYPQLCMDLKQLSVALGSPRHPPQISTEHHALADARWARDLFIFLQTVKASSVRYRDLPLDEIPTVLDDMTLREFQRLNPWGANTYSTEFEADPAPHKQYRHDVGHLFKTVGKLSELAFEMDHDPKLAAAYRAEDCKRLADLVIFAMHMASTHPSGPIDLASAIQERVAQTVERMTVKNRG